MTSLESEGKAHVVREGDHLHTPGLQGIGILKAPRRSKLEQWVALAVVVAAPRGLVAVHGEGCLDILYLQTVRPAVSESALKMLIGRACALSSSLIWFCVMHCAQERGE